MKHKTIASLLVAAPTLASAGEPVYSAPIAPPPPPMCESSWFLGAGADYLLDAEEAYLNGHFGYDFGCGHSVFLEVGWVDQNETFTEFVPVTIPGVPQTPSAPNPGPTTFFVPITGSIDVEIIPVTFNYKYEHSLTDRLGLYVGLGLGASYIDVEASAGPVRASDSDWSFTAQAFAGLVYNATDSFEIYAGARYLWIDDPTIFGSTSGDNLDDFGLGGGIRFNF